jgi:hypothetical protein
MNANFPKNQKEASSDAGDLLNIQSIPYANDGLLLSTLPLTSFLYSSSPPSSEGAKYTLSAEGESLVPDLRLERPLPPALLPLPLADRRTLLDILTAFFIFFILLVASH